MVTTETMVSIAVTVVIFMVMLFATYLFTVDAVILYIFTVHIYSDVFICFYGVIGVYNNNSDSNRVYSEFVFWN